MIDIQEIMSLLPHRYPFLLVDCLIEFEPNKRAVGIKNVTANEPFFPGHFPGRPIMPAVLIMEALAQTGGVLALKSLPEEERTGSIFFTGIDEARFRRPVVPGDRLHLVLDVLKHRREIWVFAGQALVGNERVAEARIMAMLKKE
jgi:3-hydroxyacyl-[acyl-carrier-protein] dehydratase